MTETQLTQLVSATSPELPIQPEFVDGAVYLEGFDDRLGELESAYLTFTTSSLVQAFILEFFGSYGIAAVESQLTVGFTAGTESPDFDPVNVFGAGASIGAFVGPFGSGLPFTYYQGFSTVVPIADVSGLSETPEFEITFRATGLNSPTFNGVPTAASTPVNYFLATANIYYTYSAFQYGNGADTVRGDVVGNFVNLGGGNDWFDGGGGDDTVIGGAGNDRLKGGDGNDTADYSVATGGVTVYLSYTGRDVGGGQGADRLSEIESLTGSQFDDRLVGDDGANTLSGGAGADVLKFKGGDDQGFGGGGADRMLMGDGDDSADGGWGSDILSGYAGNDTLNGDGGRDFMYGGLGSDIMDGGDGNDVMRGNRNADEMSGGAGEDTMRGGGGDDTLDGGADDDWISGGNGADRIAGGAGNDVLIGGSSGTGGDGAADVFVFQNIDSGTGAGFDRVKDFEDGIDRIDITEFFTYSFEDLLPYLEDTASGVRVNTAEDWILLEGISLSQLDASDFIFP